MSALHPPVRLQELLLRSRLEQPLAGQQHPSSSVDLPLWRLLLRRLCSLGLRSLLRCGSGPRLRFGHTWRRCRVGLAGCRCWRRQPGLGHPLVAECLQVRHGHLWQRQAGQTDWVSRASGAQRPTGTGKRWSGGGARRWRPSLPRALQLRRPTPLTAALRSSTPLAWLKLKARPVRRRFCCPRRRCHRLFVRSGARGASGREPRQRDEEGVT